MFLDNLTEFFKWCTLINIALFTFWILWLMLAPDLVYKIQTRFFPMPREHFDRVMYAFLGAFKLLLIFFNLVPFLALKFFVS